MFKEGTGLCTCVYMYLIWDYNCAIYCDFVISMWHNKVIMPCKILSGI